MKHKSRIFLVIWTLFVLFNLGAQTYTGIKMTSDLHGWIHTEVIYKSAYLEVPVAVEATNIPTKYGSVSGCAMVLECSSEFYSVLAKNPFNTEAIVALSSLRPAGAYTVTSAIQLARLCKPVTNWNDREQVEANALCSELSSEISSDVRVFLFWLNSDIGYISVGTLVKDGSNVKFTPDYLWVDSYKLVSSE